MTVRFGSVIIRRVELGQNWRSHLLLLRQQAVRGVLREDRGVVRDELLLGDGCPVRLRVLPTRFARLPAPLGRTSDEARVLGISTTDALL